MPKYLFRGTYTAAGANGVLREGGTSRSAAAVQLIESVGGSLESIYWTLGDDDFIVIADVPDEAAVATLSMTVASSGSLRVTTTPLLTASDLDTASSRAADYRPPGE